MAPRLRLADLLGGLSIVADLGFGLPPQEAMRTSVVSTALARLMDLPVDDVRDAFYVPLLMHTGCISMAHETAAPYGDELAVTRAVSLTDLGDPDDFGITLLPELTRGMTPAQAARVTQYTVAHGIEFGRRFDTASCEVARATARRIGLPAGTQRALYEEAEFWGGRRRAAVLAGRRGRRGCPGGASGGRRRVLQRCRWARTGGGRRGQAGRRGSRPRNRRHLRSTCRRAAGRGRPRRQRSPRPHPRDRARPRTAVSSGRHRGRRRRICRSVGPQVAVLPWPRDRGGPAGDRRRPQDGPGRHGHRPRLVRHRRQVRLAQAEVVGLDTDTGSITDARAHAERAGIDVRFEVAGDSGGADLTAHGPFDVVLLLDTLHDMARPVEVLISRSRKSIRWAGRDHVEVRVGSSAASWAEESFGSVRDDPAGRKALMERCYHGPFGKAPRHLPYRRAAMSFMHWQLRRGVLQPPFAHRPGSAWWRAVNERIIRDGCEAVALSGGLPGPTSSRTVDHWMSFVHRPTARAWYRAHNGSVVSAYLEHRDLAEAENAAERFFMNVVLCRVLYAHALVAVPRISLGWLRPLAPLLGDPRLGMAGIFLQLSRVLPDEYPLRDSVGSYLEAELGFGRLVDFGVIVPRLQQLFEWSADELGAPGLVDCVRDGAMTYAWAFEDRDVWRPPNSLILRMAHRALRPAGSER